jgi:nucleoside-diphosphate-sugar epimerase
MEIGAFKAVGRNHKNEVVDEALAEASPRLVIMNPNLILGPQLDPGEIKGNSLPWVCRILKKQTMSEYIPNDSMSIIDVRDLAALHVAAAMNESASGRYFGVNKSFSWKEILGAFGEVCEDYTPPGLKEGEDYEGKVPTQFDHTRKESLGVELRPLKETLGDLVGFLREKGAI